MVAFYAGIPWKRKSRGKKDGCISCVKVRGLGGFQILLIPGTKLKRFK
jgi:hypothetical protein